MMDRKFIGNSAAFSAAALFGASVVATRMAVGSIPPLSLAFLRFGQGGNWALLGDLLMLLTAICGAIYGVLAQKMLKKYKAITVNGAANGCRKHQ